MSPRFHAPSSTLIQAVSLALLGSLPALALAQTLPAMDTPSPSLLVSPLTTPAATPPVPATPTSPESTSPPSAPVASGTPATPTSGPSEAAPVSHPFVAAVAADKVYIRSGPGPAYYEIGQLAKGDLVYIVGSTRGWYQILPPNGTYCLIAKDMVQIDQNGGGGGATGTVAKDFVNIRAGTAINKNRDPFAVLTVARKGTRLKILGTGTDDKFYEIAPPERAYVFISPQFVRAIPGIEYHVSQLKLPAGAVGPSVTTVEAPTTPPALASTPTTPPGVATPGSATPIRPTVETVPVPGDTGPAVAAGGDRGGGDIRGNGDTPTQVGTTAVANAVEPLPPIAPKITYSETATAKFRDANAKYQDESKKPPTQQNPDALLKDFQDILAMENISPSVKAGSEANIAAIERTLTVQRLMKEQATAQEMTQRQSEALRQQFDEAQRAIAAAREAGPYSAEGILQTSTIVQGKYALVSPQTRRVVAYVDPSSSAVDIGRLIGKYIGIRGISRKMEGSDITLVEVSNATLLPEPAGTAQAK